MLARAAAVSIALLAVALVSCGSEDPGKPALVSAKVSGAPGYLDRSALQLRLGNAFRDGLYRLAVMSQPEDQAVDAGQPLPSGKLRSVDCSPAAAGASAPDRDWRCVVAWRTVTGTARSTRYAVRLTSRSCYDASAVPRYSAILDSTIGTVSEHPLNTFGRSLGAC